MRLREFFKDHKSFIGRCVEFIVLGLFGVNVLSFVYFALINYNRSVRILNILNFNKMQ